MGNAEKIRILYKLLNGRKKLLKILEKTAFLIGNGLPVKEAVESQLRIARDTKDIVSEFLLRLVLSSLARGDTMSDGIKDFISNEEYILLNNAEKTGHLQTAIDSILKVEKQKREALKSLKEGITEPLLVLAVALVLVYYLGAKVLPPIINFIGKGKLTGTTKLLLYLSDFVRSPFFFGGIVAFIVLGIAVFLSFPYLKGRVRVFLDRFIPYSIYREYTGIMFLVSLSIMVSSGIPIIQSLKYMLPNSSPYLKERIRSYIILMSKGKSLGEALYESGFNFPDREAVYDLLTFSRYPRIQERTFDMVQRELEGLRDSLKSTAWRISVSLQTLVYVLTILIALASANIVMSINVNF